uniref:Hedgehog/Intein (Hint) domain-containing protein n=1 Tax=viral metagenome TaxID=1070528 RepID=A0A6C0D178_9ZZZZ
MSIENAVNIANYPILSKYTLYTTTDAQLNIVSLNSSLSIVPNANLCYYYAKSFTGNPISITDASEASGTDNATALVQLNSLSTDIDSAATTFPTTNFSMPVNGSSTISTPGVYILQNNTGETNCTLVNGRTLTFDAPGTYVMIYNNTGNLNLYGTIQLTNGATANNIYWKSSTTINLAGNNVKGQILLVGNTSTPVNFNLTSVSTFSGSLFLLGSTNPLVTDTFTITFNDNLITPSITAVTPFYLENYATLSTFGILANAGNIVVQAPSLTLVPQNTYFTNYGSSAVISGNPIIGGTLVSAGGTLTAAIQDLNTLCTNLLTYIEIALNLDYNTLPVLSFPSAGNSITLTHGIYFLRVRGDFVADSSIICNGPGTYLLYTRFYNFKLYGNIVLQNGALATDIYWFSLQDTVEVYGTNIQGIIVQQLRDGFGVLRLDSATLNGCMYYNVEGGGTANFEINGTACTLNSQNYCFLRGTHILTSDGYIPIEDLCVGDLILSYGSITDDKDITYHSNPILTPVKWIQSFRPPCKTTDTWPICFQKHSLGLFSPRQDLWISPTHRMIMDGKMKSACEFINGETIIQDLNLVNVEYFHVEVEPHSVIDAEGVKVESFINFDYSFRNQPSLNDNRII